VFNCTYKETDYSVAPSIQWDLPSRLHNDASVTIFKYRYTSFLQISNATLYDSIRVRCLVQFPLQDQYSNYAMLSVSSKDFTTVHYACSNLLSLPIFSCNVNIFPFV